MRIRKIFLISLIILSISGLCFGQKVVEDENWLREIAGEYCSGYSILTYQYKNFSKQDVANAKEKLKLIKQFVPKNEWEGVYANRSVAVGDEGLVWNSEGGFFSFYCYHDLRSLNYGKVKGSADFVELVSEEPAISNNKKQAAKIENKLIKVKIGERHFLVPENYLNDFTVEAAGLSTKLQNYSFYYWEKVDDIEKKIFGLPILPEKYKNFLRFPIETEITRIGSRKIAKARSFPPSEEIHYPVTLKAGKNDGLKKQMNFFVEDLGEWIQITKVFQTSSNGFIRRDFNENRQEQCFNNEGGSGLIIPCKEIKIGMKARTKGNF